MKVLAVAAVLALTVTAMPAWADDDYPPVSIYGMVRLDAIVNDSTMSDARAPYWVEREPGRSDAELTVSPRLSRIGLSLDEWELNHRWSGAGLLEVDFAGGDASADAGLRLRHAYVTLAREQRFEVLLGQTWDLASPLFPSVNADTMMWNAGNTGDRRPQLRLSAFPGGGKATVAVAVGQTGAVDRQDADMDGRLDGTEGGLPTVQGLIELRPRLPGGGQLRLGVWGHAAREQLAAGPDLPSRAIGGHLYVPMARVAVLMVEAHRGRNLDDLRGGIGQGYNIVRGRSIDATGGWVEAAIFLSRHHLFAFGETIDAVDEDDVEPGDRLRNLSGYAVLRWRPTEAVEVGAEYGYWITSYKQMDRPPALGTAHRVDLHASVSF